MHLELVFQPQIIHVEAKQTCNYIMHVVVKLSKTELRK